MKNHALHHLTKMQDHHENMAKVHAGLAEHHHGLHKGLTADDHQHQIATHHEVAASYHKDMASHCEDMQRAIRAGDGDSTAGAHVDTSVPTNANSFGGHQFSAAQLADELVKRWGMNPSAAPIPANLTAVAPSNESLRRTARLIDRDGTELDPRTGDALGKSAKEPAAESPLSHWFE